MARRRRVRRARCSESGRALELQLGMTSGTGGAATALADGLTDFCYSYDGAQKPLEELRSGAPAVYDREKTKIELPVSGKSL